jgi:hypothetical protein
MDRKREQAELLVLLGRLFGPMLSYADNPGTVSLPDRARVFARFFADRPRFLQAFIAFTQSEPGHLYLIEQAEGVRQIGNLEHFLQPVLASPEAQSHLILEKYKAVLDIIQSIPVVADSAIIEASSPFAAYCFLRDRAATVKRRIDWVDRYMDASLFHRFLRDTPLDAVVTLVTWPEAKLSSAKDKSRYNAFIDVSRIFAAERGIDHYSLLTHDKIHDRWLRCDDELYSLGGSAKDAGQSTDFTVSRIEPYAANMKQVDELVANGKRLFGPGQLEHLA